MSTTLFPVSQLPFPLPRADLLSRFKGNCIKMFALHSSRDKKVHMIIWRSNEEEWKGCDKSTLIQKEIKFSSYIRKFSVEQLQKVIYEEGLPNI
jgi:hypothetical protein